VSLKFVPKKEGIGVLSIVCMSKFKTENGAEDVEVCYETTTDGDRFYGLAAWVVGEWFVSMPRVKPISGRLPFIPTGLDSYKNDKKMYLYLRSHPPLL
jgi:hypothetical protein